MVRSLARAAGPAKWHRSKGHFTPYWSRRLTLDEFNAHDFVINSDAIAETPLEAFAIRQEENGHLLGIVFSKPSDNHLRHTRRSNRFVWHFVDWRLDVVRQYRPGWDTRVLRDWHSRDRAVEALLENDAEWRSKLARESAARRDAEALNDFYL